MLSLFLLLSFLVSPAHAAGEDGAVSQAAVETVNQSGSDLRASAQVKQEVIPQLTARKITAENRIKAAEKYFAGDLTLPEAFPNWSDAPLTEPAFLVSSQVTLDQAAIARASERVSAAGQADALEGTQIGREWKRAMRLATEAEDQADALRRRFLAGCQAGIAQAPGLNQQALDAENARLSALSKSMTLDAENPDPEVAARIQRAGVAQGRLWGLRDAAVHAMTVPGSDALEEWIDADLKMAAETPDSDVFHRLAIVAPLLDPTRQSDVRGVQFAQETDDLIRRQQQLDASVAEVFPETQESLEELLAEAQGARDAWHETLNSQDQANDGAHEALMVLRRAVAEKEHEVATARVAAIAEALDVHSVEQDRIELEKLENAQLQMDEARAEAEAAKVAANSNETLLNKELQDQIARLRSEIATLLEEEYSRHGIAVKSVENVEGMLSDAQTMATAALAIPPLDPRRVQAIDDAYLRLWEVVQIARGQLDERGAALTGIKKSNAASVAELGDLPAGLEQSRGSGSDNGTWLRAAEEWRQANQDYLRALDAKQENAQVLLDSTVWLLVQAKAQRRIMRRHASAEVQQQVQSAFFMELGEEFRELPVRLGAECRKTFASVRDLPMKTLDLTYLGAVISGSLELLLVFLFWGVLRGQGAGWVSKGLLALDDAAFDEGAFHSGRAVGLARWLRDILDSWGAPGRYRLLVRDGQHLFGGMVDFGLMLVLLGSIGEKFELVGFCLMVWGAWLIWDRAPSFVRLLAVPSGARPGFRRVESTTRALIQLSVRQVLYVIILARLAQFFIGELLDADRLLELCNLLIIVAWVVVLHRLLAGWARMVRSSIARGDSNNLSRLLVRPLESRLLGPIYTLAGVTYLSLVGLVRLLGQLIDNRAGLAWAGALLARRRLREVQDADWIELPAEVIKSLENTSDSGLFSFDGISTTGDLLGAWKSGRRRGVVAVIGDWGEGREQVLKVMDDRWSDGMAVSHLDLPDHMASEPDALAWMAKQVGIPSGSVEELVERFSAMPPQVFVVDSMHRLFLRAVGGFDALTAVLEVMHATSEEHFWVCGFHEPSWHYLEAVHDAVNLAVFRELVVIQSLDPHTLATRVLARTKAAGIEPSFLGLVTASRLESDPTRSLQRATDAFWRLLHDASQGNPSVAWGLWLESLRGGAGENEAMVTVLTAPVPGDLGAAGDIDLFVLTALIIHNGLHISDLAAVLNLPEGGCRATCRKLESQGILTGDAGGNRFGVCLRWLPAVERFLRQKHFLHTTVH